VRVSCARAVEEKLGLAARGPGAAQETEQPNPQTGEPGAGGAGQVERHFASLGDRDAFGSACASVTSSSMHTWYGVPVRATLVPGTPTPVTIAMHR